MASSERTEGQTPNGGAYSIVYFRDADGKPVDKEQAIAAEAIEFDAAGNQIFRTYLQIATEATDEQRSLLDR